RLLARGDLPESYVTRVSAARVRLTTDRECLFHGDGEILGPAPVEIEVLPKAVRVLAPATPSTRHSNSSFTFLASALAKRTQRKRRQMPISNPCRLQPQSPRTAAHSPRT